MGRRINTGGTTEGVREGWTDDEGHRSKGGNRDDIGAGGIAKWEDDKHRGERERSCSLLLDG